MHITKLDFFLNRFAKEDLISGFYNSGSISTVFGQPCVVDLKRSKPLSSILENDREKIRLEIKSILDNKGNLDEAKNLLDKSFKSLLIYYPIIFGNPYENWGIVEWSPLGFFFSNKTPIFFDNPKYIEIEKDFAKEAGFAKNILEDLKQHRFVNYTQIGVSRSSYKKISNYISELIQSFLEEYPQVELENGYNNYNLDFYMTVVSDVLSISVYKLADVLPIFNNKKAEGVVIEIVLTSSEIYSVKDKTLWFVRPDRFATIKFFLAKYKEDVFTIDGKLIHRLCELQPAKGLVWFTELLSNNVPNDMFSAKKQQKSV